MKNAMNPAQKVIFQLSMMNLSVGEMKAKYQEIYFSGVKQTQEVVDVEVGLYYALEEKLGEKAFQKYLKPLEVKLYGFALS
jgi:hypothetical protein